MGTCSPGHRARVPSTCCGASSSQNVQGKSAHRAGRAGSGPAWDPGWPRARPLGVHTAGGGLRSARGSQHPLRVGTVVPHCPTSPHSAPGGGTNGVPTPRVRTLRGPGAVHVPRGSELGGAAPRCACVPTSAPGDGDPPCRKGGPLLGKGPRPPSQVAKALETFVTHLLL